MRLLASNPYNPAFEVVMKQIFRRGAAVAALTALSACAAAPPLNYIQPPGLTAQSAATITGSMDVSTNPLISNTRVALMEVDNQPVKLRFADWQTPTLVTPGIHLLTFGPCQCGGFMNLTGPAGSITLAANFKSGAVYTLRSSQPVSAGLFTPDRAVAWIEDGSGAPVTTKTPLQFAASPRPVFLPVFIPVK